MGFWVVAQRFAQSHMHIHCLLEISQRLWLVDFKPRAVLIASWLLKYSEQDCMQLSCRAHLGGCMWEMLNCHRLWANIWHINQRKEFFFFFKMFGLHDCLSEIVLKISVCSEDVESMLGLTLPFWSMPWSKSVTRRLRSIVVWRQSMNWHMANLPQRAVVTNVWLWYLCLPFSYSL